MKTLMEMENSGFIALIEGQKYEDLGRMYTIFKRVPGGLDLLRATMGGYIRATGKELVQARPQGGDASSTPMPPGLWCSPSWRLPSSATPRVGSRFALTSSCRQRCRQQETLPTCQQIMTAVLP